VTIQLAGGVASLESEVRHGVGDAELKGIVEAVPPATPSGIFRAAGRAVQTTAATTFRRGSASAGFNDLAVGRRVEVRGALSGDVVVASAVEIEDGAKAPGPEGPDPVVEVEITGALSGLSGTAASFQFTVAGRLFRGSEATLVVRGGSNRSFGALANGQTVEVKGTQQNGFVQASRISIEGPEGGDDNGGRTEVEVEGVLGAVSGACPALASSVAGTPFSTTASTVFDAPCGSFKAGNRVQVKGTRTGSGPIAATRLRLK
jgi:hypothetical protein